MFMPRNLISGPEGTSACSVEEAAVFGLQMVPLWQSSAPGLTQCFSEQGINTQAPLPKTLSPSQSWTETKNEPYTLIKKPPNSKHLFCLRGMIGLVCS